MSDLQWDRAFALEQAGDDEELLAELLDLLRTSAADDLERIKAAAAAGKAGAVADAAHNTKGAAASLGVDSLRRVAHALEEAGRSGNLAAVEPDIAAMAGLIAQLRTIS